MGKLIKVDFKNKKKEKLLLTKVEIDTISDRLREIMRIRELCTDRDSDVLDNLSMELDEINSLLRENFINSRKKRLQNG